MTSLNAPSATSAIPGMTVAGVRSALKKMRELWSKSSPNGPLFFCDTLCNDRSIADFATAFVYGHHLKRHHKPSLRKQAAEELAKATTATAPGERHGMPGPKGGLHDPFPFTPGWKPRTEAGIAAFAAAAASASAVTNATTAAAAAVKPAAPPVAKVHSHATRTKRADGTHKVG